MNAMRALFLATLVFSLASCAELDISHDGAVDFSRYKTVAVDVDSDYLGDGTATSYLIHELNDVSGFEKAVSLSTTADLTLSVWVQVSSYQDSDGYLNYVADVHYQATTPTGETLVDDTVSDTSGSPSEAEEDALDEVARVFIPPYDY